MGLVLSTVSRVLTNLDIRSTEYGRHGIVRDFMMIVFVLVEKSIYSDGLDNCKGNLKIQGVHKKHLLPESHLVL